MCWRVCFRRVGWRHNWILDRYSFQPRPLRLGSFAGILRVTFSTQCPQYLQGSIQKWRQMNLCCRSCAGVWFFFSKTATKKPPESCKWGYIRILERSAAEKAMKYYLEIPKGQVQRFGIFWGEMSLSQFCLEVSVKLRILVFLKSLVCLHGGLVNAWSPFCEPRPPVQFGQHWRNIYKLECYETNNVKNILYSDFPSSDIPGFIFKASAMTASFSTGFKEHVEYTIRPSCLSRLIARWRMRTCKLR